jgi:hypothetical protein
MPGTLPHTENGFVQTAAEQQFREPLDERDSAAADSTTLKFEGKIAVSDEDAGSDPYNRTGKFRRLVR